MLKIQRLLLLFCFLALLPFQLMAASVSQDNHRSDTYQVQLSVWNQSNQSIRLICQPTPGVTMSQQSYDITVNDSPAIPFTANHYGKLVTCSVTGSTASFDYSVITKNKESVKITPATGGMPNFHYDPAYPGALTYK